MELKYLLMITLISLTIKVEGLIFRPDQFKDMTETCKKSDGKPLRFILNEDNPAMYVSIDPAHPALMDIQRAERVKLVNKVGWDDKGRLLFQDLIPERNKRTNYIAVANTLKFSARNEDGLWPIFAEPSNETFDCVLHFETQLPTGDKTDEKYDALSLIIIELDFNEKKPHGTVPIPVTDLPNSNVELVTFGHDGYTKKKVTKRAQYSDRLWPGSHNPNFLLSGQLSGFDSIDYRTKIDAQHIVKPENLHSTFDKPAFITINVTNWSFYTHIYMSVTTYKYLRRGERCQENKEFDCTSPNFLGSSVDHMCMSVNLACDGLPNCGQDFLPNQDENCFKIHWSSVLLSLVSYILLAITLLLCLSCFARVLIQWSVRSSLAELRGMNSPTGSFRSSARFFSFLGTTFSGRWERPPPTYDEAMKHVNPDLAPRPQDPPPYTEASGRSARRASVHGSMVDTPPPEYRSQEGLNQVPPTETTTEDEGVRHHHHHHHHHRRHHSRHTCPTPKAYAALQRNPPPPPGPEMQAIVEAQICAYNLCS